MPDRLGEAVESIPLEEHAAVVGELPGGDLVRVRDGELADLHCGSLATASIDFAGAGPRRDFAHEDPRHRRSRVHRLELRAPHPRGRLPGPRRSRRRRLRRPHLLRQPREPRAGRRLAPLRVRARRHPRRRAPRPHASGVDAIVHFAAESHVDRSVLDAGPFVETNVVGTQRLLDAALRAGVPRFVHVSTDEVYGSIAEGSWDENRPLEPNSPYSASKAGSDLLARSFHRTHGMNVSITRCSNNYGPYHFPEKVIPLFVTNLIDGKSVPLYGTGENVRDWLHVDDHTRGIALVLDARPRRRDLQHRRRHRADQRRAHRTAARRDRPRLVGRRPRRGPQGPRPALLGRHLEDPQRTRIRAARAVRAGARRRRAVVPRPSRLVGAAQSPSRARLMRPRS